MKKYLLISIALHFFLVLTGFLFLIVWNITWYDTKNHVGVYLDNKTITKSTEFLAIENNGGENKNKKDLVMHAKRYPLHKNSADLTRVKLKDDKINNTTILLHDLITKQIKYPKNILGVVKNKKIYLSFILFPDGRIADSKILSTSSMAILDIAALNAVVSLSGSELLLGLVLSPAEFRVPIEFVF